MSNLKDVYDDSGVYLSCSCVDENEWVHIKRCIEWFGKMWDWTRCTKENTKKKIHKLYA